jgi:hypothetical protein
MSNLQDFSLYSSIPDYLRKSYAAQMIRFAPNGMAPLFGLTNMAGTGTALSVEHGYFAKTMVFPSVTLTAAVTDGVQTTFAVASTLKILPGDLLRSNTTGEIVRVQTVASPTSITVVRGVGQIPAAAIGSGVVLYGVGNAHEQGSLRPPSRLMNPVRVMNNTQIFRNSWALPGTMDAIAPIVGDSLSAESKRDCGMFHAADIEKAIIFGQKSGQIVNGQYLTTMDGIVETVRRLAPSDNTTVAGATTDYDELEAALEPCFDTITNGRNGNERVLIVGGTARKVINQIGRVSGQYQIVDGQTNFGLQFQTFKTSRGTFRMIEHPMLNSNPDWKKMAMALDLPSVKLMYLGGRKTQNREYNMSGTPVDSGIDAVGGTLTTECTMEITNPSAHAVIFGLTQGVAVTP